MSQESPVGHKLKVNAFYTTKEKAKEAIHSLKTAIAPKDNGFLVTEYWMWEVIYDENGYEVDASTLDLSEA